MSCPADCPLLCCNNSIRQPNINCSIGECASDEKLDLKICGYNHDEYTVYSDWKVADFDNQKKDGDIPYFLYPTARFDYYTMFQEITFDKIILQDIQIEIELLAYHGSNRNIKLFTDNLEIPTREGTETLLPLMGKMYFTAYLVLICDIDLAKKKNYTPSDFLRDPNNLTYIEPKNSVKILEKYTIEILCQEECVFSSHRIAMCVKFAKDTKMCLLNKNVQNEDVFFNRGKFVLFTVINYLDPLFDVRRNYPNVQNSYLFGDGFNVATGTVGHSIFFRKFHIQGAYKPAVTFIQPSKLALVYNALQEQQQREQQE